MIYTVTIPNDCATDLVEGICHEGGYQEYVADGEGGTIPNPESKVAFAKRFHKEWLQKKYIAQRERSNDATRTALVNTATTESEGFEVT